MWALLILAAGLAAAVWYERNKIITTLQQEGWTPVPAGPPPPAPTAPPGVVPTTPNPAGGVSVLLTPGNLGTLNVAGATGFPPPGVALNVQTPTTTSPGGIGWIGNVTSSNPNIVPTTGVLISPGQPGQMTAPLTVMAPGTTTITVQWNDGANSQTTTFTVNATA